MFSLKTTGRAVALALALAGSVASVWAEENAAATKAEQPVVTKDSLSAAIASQVKT